MDDGLLKKLQAVQNAAARATTETRKFDHIIHVLRELHWLPVRKRIVHKLAVMVYKCLRLHGMAPSYLAADCVPVILLCPVASLSLERILDSGRETLRSLEPRSGTVCRLMRLHAQSIETFGQELKQYFLVVKSASEDFFYFALSNLLIIIRPPDIHTILCMTV